MGGKNAKGTGKTKKYEVILEMSTTKYLQLFKNLERK